MIETINLTMLTDFYELTMANGYFKKGYKDKIAYFDMFFRKIHVREKDYPDYGYWSFCFIDWSSYYYWS